MKIFNENVHANNKRLIVELTKGKEIAIQLQTLVHNPVKDEGSISTEELAIKILTSFNEILSMVTSCTPSLQISDSDEIRKKKPGVKDRRGCYKRKRTSDSWATVSPAIEDGYAWRKYGQKAILNSKYPRCYYRCTNKYQGCKATKQVQKMKDDQFLYHTTYFNHHTCTDQKMIVPQLIVESDPVDSNLLSFQANIIPLKQDHCPNSLIISVAKQESQKDIQTDGISCAKSLQDHNRMSWQGIAGTESLGHESVWSPRMISYDEEEEVSGLYSCASTALHELDMEVRQLGHTNNFHF